MTKLDMITERLKSLPPDKQQEILDYIEFLQARYGKPRPLHSVRGLCADLVADLPAEAIDEARREMWGNFPRGDVA